MKKILAFSFFLFLGNLVQAQMLDYQNTMTITIKEGNRSIPIVVYGKANSLSEDFTNEYFYLPTNLRLATKLDEATGKQIPSFVLAKYTTEQREDAGGVQGALLHFLMEWGLTEPQIKLAENKLNEKIAKLSQQANSPYKKITSGSATIKGPVMLLPDKEESFKIVSAVMSDEKMNRKTVSSGKVPLLPGSKIAVASMLDKNGAQLLASTFEKGRSISDVSLMLNFKYQVLTPSVKGKIIVDWSKISTDTSIKDINFERSIGRLVGEDKKKKYGKKIRWEESVNYTELEMVRQSLVENGVFTVKIDGDANNPMIQEIIQTYTQKIIESLADKEIDEENDEKSNSEPISQDNLMDNTKGLGRRNAFKYHFNKQKYISKIKTQYQEFNLEVRTPVELSHSITENLVSHYNQVKDNKKCVYSANLNDPFFQHREINLVTDAEAAEMINAGEINYATLAIRKKRDSGNPFNDSRTIDKSYLEKNGQRINLTYARGEDKNSDVYEYKVQYAMKGGKIIPENPQWKKGDWAGITIASPIKLQKLELEGNLEELQSQGISRVTMQVRYYKYGQEREDKIDLSVAGGKSLVEKNIYMDRNAQGYVYRIVYNDKTEGKLATEWDSKINDFYVYASIPKELKERIPTFINRMKELGKLILPVGSDGVVAETGKVLDKFKNLIEKVF